MAPTVPNKITCTTAKDLRYALDPLRPLAEQPETEENWEKISRAIQTFGALARGGATDLDAEYVKEIRGFSAMMLNSMSSERTRLSNVAVDLFTIIAPALGNKFEPLISIFVPTLIRLLGRTNKVFVSRATAGLQSIISNCPHPRILLELRIMATDKSASLRVLVAGAVLQCLSEWDWSVPPFASKVGEIESVIRSMGTDSNVDARRIARQIFDLYKQMFPDRLNEFLEPLTPVIKRYLDIKAKATRAEGTTAARKQAPVPAPRFPERRPAPAPAPALPIAAQQTLEAELIEPAPPKMTRVGASRAGPSRTTAANVGLGPPPIAPVHSRIVSGPERMTSHVHRDPSADAARSGPMRAPSSSASAPQPPVMRSVSSSGPSRVRVEPSASVPQAVSQDVVDPMSSSYPQPLNGPSRRFRPARAPMDPSQMPQRVAIPLPNLKHSTDSKKIDGPGRVNLGNNARVVSAPAPTIPPTQAPSTTVKPGCEVKATTDVSEPSASTNDSSASVDAAPAPRSTPVMVAPEPAPMAVPMPSPTVVSIPASAPVSRSTSAVPSESRPSSVASAVTSKAQSTTTSISTEPTSAPAPVPAKPTLVSSKSAPVSAKVSALIKRGNPNAPPPFVPKRNGAATGVGAGTASQMTRQREAIAAREKREAEEAAKKARRDAVQKKEAQRKEKSDKQAEAPAPSKSSRTHPIAPQAPKVPVKGVPAAPRKAAVLSKSKPQGGPPRVNVKDMEPEMAAAVTVPLPGSPTPLAVREVPLPASPVAAYIGQGENVDVEDMVLDTAVLESAMQEPVIVEQPIVEAAAEVVQTLVKDISTTNDTTETEKEDEDAVNQAERTIMADNEEPVLTPPRTTQVSLIDQTPASTPIHVTPAGFAFHPQLAQFMALPPQPVEEVEDFLVDLSSPPPKDRVAEKEGTDRFALGERGNTNTYLSQFTQDMMMLSGL